ncbi:hypothetical protein GB937_003049 [Aspergillus fischeri]|nr:hypothetical protein GB937_003049 [Aspergillus fischeri]
MYRIAKHFQETVWLAKRSIPPEKKKLFGRIPEEVAKEDKELILKIMKLGPRDSPSAAELLHDKWFDFLEYMDYRVEYRTDMSSQIQR